ncbi:MAG: matrixin family metalloprotease, partial [Acidobacteria bacterium]|nr:matrixin family metalloprotease [Acidobacteriota bacterium]
MKLSSRKIFLIGMIICGLVSISLAYVLLGVQWPVGTNVGFYINPNTAQVTDEAWAVYYAAGTWSALDPSALKITYWGSTGVTDFGYDGSNTVCWKNEGITGPLATAYWWSWRSNNIIVEADMVFNDYYTWSTSGSNYDIETVALHEFGHWVGLDHSSTGIMYYAYSGIRQYIDSDARAGFEAMYGSAPAGPSIELDKSSLRFLGSGTDS